MKDILTVAVVNFKPDGGDKGRNLSRMCEFTEAAARRGVDLVLFPEMCLTGYDYFVDDSISREAKVNAAEPTDGPACQAISAITQKYGIYAVFGMAEKTQDGAEDVLYNSAVACGPNGVIGAYRKIHPFDTENLWCQKGCEPFLFETPWGPIGVGICYDTYQFPELQRYYVSKGARLYLNPTALLEEIGKEGSRQAFLNSYAPHLEYGVFCNTIYVASANLTGHDRESFWGGGSCIIGPKVTPFYETDVTYYAGAKDDLQVGMSLATIDLSLATRRLAVTNQITGTPDYRPDLYASFR